MTASLRFGVMSTAKIAREKVIPGIQGGAGCEVVAIASRSVDGAVPVAADLGIGTAHGSYEALLGDPEVDAVYIPLPNHLHARWSIAAMEAGKHVLCEKPLAMDGGQVRSMIETASATGMVLMEAFMYRHHPVWVTTVDLVRSGRIGDLVSVQSWFSYFNDDLSNIRNIAAYGGGALMDIGCYNVNLSRLLFDAEPDDVRAVIHRDPLSGVDVLTSADLVFGDRTASFTCSTRSAPDQRVHVVGASGRIEIEVPFNISPDAPGRIHIWDGARGAGAVPGQTLEIPPRDPYAVQAEVFASAVAGGNGTPAGWLADSVGNMATMEAIVDAAGRRT